MKETGEATVAAFAGQSVTAVFYQVTLTVTGTGEGKVAANPHSGDPQTPTFTEDYEPDGQVTLTAHPEPGWGFKRWNGDASGASATVAITMDGDKTVNAEFYQTTLTVSKTGEGQVTATPYGATQTPTFTEDYEPGQQVTLTAVPAQGWAFKEWMGGASGLSVSISVTMDGDKSVTAVFEQIQLTVNMQGQGTVTATAPGSQLTPPFTHIYTAAQNVNLDAQAAPGWGFKQWTGDAGGTGTYTSVYVDRAKTVTAVFSQVDLTVDKEGEGTVSVNPPGETLEPSFTKTYGIHSTVGVTANPASCWYFKRWEGGLTSTSASDSILLHTDMTIKAVFGFGPLSFVEPNGVPVTDNHYVFQSGVCSVNPQASIPGGGGTCELDWDLESIDGSTLSVSPNPPDTLTPLFTYTGLPTANGEFGDKALSVSDPEGVDPEETTVQIFFELHGNDHPEIPAGELENWLENPAGGSSAVPNWYYYWKQTSADFGTHVLGASSITSPPWDNPPNFVRVGADSAKISNGTWYQLDYTSQEWTIGGQGNQIEFEWDSEGIDTFSWVCRHEAMHVTVNNELWPDGRPNLKDANGNYIPEYRDADNDWFPDVLESQYGYDPTEKYTNQNGGDMVDYHDYVMWRQATDSPWTKGSAKAEDWASPGQNSQE